MDRRRELALVLGVLAALALVAVAVGPAGTGDGDDPRLSTYLSGPHGARALFLTLQELGVPASRRLQSWEEAPPGEGVLVVLGPLLPATPREAEALVEWVEAGGALVYGARRDDPIGEALGLRTRGAAPDRLSALERVRWAALRGEGIPARVADPHPWTQELPPVQGFHRVFAGGVPLLGHEGARALLRTEEGDAAVVFAPMGEGWVLAWSDPWVLSNGRLEDGAAALLFARAVMTADGEPILFDEYHHGFRAEGGPLPALRRFLASTGIGRWVLQGGIAALALLLLAGRRFGAPRPSVEGRRRSPLEHVDAVSAAYRKASARDTARRLVLAGLARRLGRRAAFDGRLSGVEDSPAGRRLKEERERGPEGDLVALAEAIDEFVAEVRGWKRVR